MSIIDELKEIYDFELNRPRMFNAELAKRDPEHYVGKELVPAGVYALHKDALALQDMFEAAKQKGRESGAAAERSKHGTRVENRFGVLSGVVKKALGLG
jgi:hypothetical protein